MSFLILFITDRAQKEMVNRTRLTHPSRQYELVRYCTSRDKTTPLSVPETSDTTDESGGGGKADVDNSLELPDDMPIVAAYFNYVERYIYSHPKARKMLSLDGDPVRGRGLLCAAASTVIRIPHYPRV